MSWSLEMQSSLACFLQHYQSSVSSKFVLTRKDWWILRKLSKCVMLWQPEFHLHKYALEEIIYNVTMFSKDSGYFLVQLSENMYSNDQKKLKV